MSNQDTAKRTVYQTEMDSVHLSEEKANQTLRLMLEENRKLKTQEHKEKPKISSRMWTYCAAVAAACLVLALALPWNGGKTTFGSVRMSGLPAVSVARGIGADAPDFETLFSVAPETLFAGWSIEACGTQSVTLQGKAAHEARLEITRDGTDLTAMVDDVKPPLLTALEEAKTGQGRDCRLNRDPDDGRQYAVYQRGGLYITLAADESLPESDFLRIVQEMMAN